MAGHVGIVGCSAEGAALCYRTTCTEGTAHRHPEVSMHTPSLHLYVERLDAGDLQGVADLMLASAEKLARAGADFLVCPDNTIHQAFHLVEPRSPLPWLHIADEVAREAQRRGFRKLGITGTHWLVASEVYPERLRAHGLDFARPTEAERLETGRLIMDELVCGIQSPRQVEYLAGVIAGLKAQGCDAVVLGCTELPLILNDGNSPLPTLDSTRLLARAALRRAAAIRP
ncbi:amino acid racemase [Ramlibacter sp. USB13]|uniref:Amino acid racemase n=1 Tax=Ramlibacter cellulosilyticus TaxID=2764187 RepID=A0A923SBX8_9BURK|nr:amino acid racemase [Ramlibacter cellulosilyticus]